MARTLNGQVVSTAMDKTAVVEVTRRKLHPLYGKKYKVSKRYLAHDPHNQAKVGLKVTLVPIPPLSRHKRWAIAEPKPKGSRK